MLPPMSETGDPALIGRRVAGKFRIEKFLGGGAMGAVYRAKDSTLDRLIALKVMHPAVAIDPSFVTRFHREARAASRLDHPSSMRVIEFGEEPDGLLYIAMEFLEGRDLYRVIHEDWPLPEARIADIMMQALSALTMAHEMGVIHRDLKPENIMVLDRKDDEGRDIVKVCDFGIAKITEQEGDTRASRGVGAKVTTAGLVVGTPEYMSPEQARGEKLDARSDLYSMGIILYQLLTGRTPFLADTALAVVLKHISEPPEPPSSIYPEVHKGLETVCMRAIAKAPDDRYPTAREMRAAIRAAIEGKPLPADAMAATGPHALAPTGRGRSSTVPIANAAHASTPPATAKTSSMPPARRSAAVPIALVAVLGITGGVVGYYLLRGAPTKVEPPPRPSADVRPVATPSAPHVVTPAPSSDHTPAPSASSEPTTEPKLVPRRGAISPAPAKSAVVEPTPAPLPEPPPPPAPEPAPTPSTPPPPLPAPTFRPATCHATVGAQKSTSAYSAKDLTLRGADASLTKCAQTSLHEKPAAPLAAVIHLRFGDRALKTTTCAACPRELAACVQKTMPSVAQLTIRSGDATGEPEFDVPVTFACD
jgi:eukaryotic-like serine/threonine-protein kinase